MTFIDKILGDFAVTPLSLVLTSALRIYWACWASEMPSGGKWELLTRYKVEPIKMSQDWVVERDVGLL